MAAKTILFFADGTWNGPGQDENRDDQPDPTNVVKLFGMLRGSDDVGSLGLPSEQERALIRDGRTLQIAKYLHGVGDSGNWLVRVLSGMFGAGVVSRIARGYTFVSRHYAPGDRIVLVGFSRGAYTVRSLAGMITSLGLLDAARVDCDDRKESYRLACAAWRHYREQRLQPQQRRPFEEVARDLPAFAHDDAIESRLTGPVPVQCVAVWDTVGALGIPRYDRTDARIDTFEFCDCRLGERVLHGYHAVAIDEQRVDFTPTLWEPRDGVQQVLFAGAHADVGGGHPMVGDESALAHHALHWMRERLLNEGVLLKDTIPAEYRPGHDGPAHRPWLGLLWSRRPCAPRAFARFADHGLQLHPSVLERMQASGPFRLLPDDEDGHLEPRYAPPNVQGVGAAGAARAVPAL